MDPDNWTFIAKGAANAVYGSNKGNKVLRLRLDAAEGDTTQIYEYLKSPHFDSLREWMMEVELIDLGRSFLEKLQQKSPTDAKLKLSETHGLLMPNVFLLAQSQYDKISLNKWTVFYKGSNNELLFEFKPKWLYEPPQDFTLCRNCAQAVAKNQDIISCQLLLVKDPKQWCKDVQKATSISVYDQLVSALEENYGLIKELYMIQNTAGFNIHERLASLTSQSDVDEFLQLSMTLKDVTIFLDLKRKKAVLLDLDEKPVSKWKQWRTMELKLADSYKGNGHNCSLSH